MARPDLVVARAAGRHPWSVVVAVGLVAGFLAGCVDPGR